MHWSKRRILVLALSVLIVAALLGLVVTQQNDRARVSTRAATRNTSARNPVVDQTPYRTATSLQNLASTADEQELALEAVHLADREVDFTFASALRRAKETPPVQTKETAEINRRIKFLQARLQAQQADSERLTQLAAQHGKYDATAVQEQLEVGKAQVALLQDAIDDAQQDLVRAGGDPEAQIQQELEAHEGLLQHGNGTSGAAGNKPQVFAVRGNLLSQFHAWLSLRENFRRLLDARQEANNTVNELTKKHQALEKGVSDSIQLDDSVGDEDTAPASAAADTTRHAAKIATLNKLSQNTKTLSSYDKRIDLERQLGGVYGDWANLVNAQMRLAMRAMLRSLLWILLALLALTIVEGSIERFYVSLGPDRRRLGATRLALRFVSQLIGVLVILLVFFGLPSQLSTVLALAGAGLTVALKDFIVAFFGWFVLVGRQGIRVGDWVEINGVGGEVLQIGLLRTILLETGSWNDTGHLTGRRVSFVNSFAVEGHYFNFTTTGQWMWDQLNVLIPAGEDSYQLTNSVLTLVTEETRADAALAEQEWQRVNLKSAVQTFSAVPAIEVRPSNLGINLVVRYVVHAHDRHQVRTKLYQAIVELLHRNQLTRSGSGGAAAAR